MYYSWKMCVHISYTHTTHTPTACFFFFHQSYPGNSISIDLNSRWTGCAGWGYEGGKEEFVWICSILGTWCVIRDKPEECTSMCVCVCVCKRDREWDTNIINQWIMRKRVKNVCPVLVVSPKRVSHTVCCAEWGLNGLQNKSWWVFHEI